MDKDDKEKEKDVIEGEKEEKKNTTGGEGKGDDDMFVFGTIQYKISYYILKNYTK